MVVEVEGTASVAAPVVAPAGMVLWFTLPGIVLWFTLPGKVLPRLAVSASLGTTLVRPSQFFFSSKTTVLSPVVDAMAKGAETTDERLMVGEAYVVARGAEATEARFRELSTSAFGPPAAPAWARFAAEY